MGNICGRDAQSQVSSRNPEQPIDRQNSNSLHEDADASDLLNTVEKIKEYHRNRLRYELEKDPQRFILDNLLMCIQFYDSFDKAVIASNEFKRNVEREMTELLSKDPQEGMILGDRRIKLLSGMGHVLSRNYIYRGKNHPDDEIEIDSYYGGVGLKDTFMNEGILPLEFLMSWDNFEVYEPHEVDAIKDYSDAKGASPSARFSMEQPNKKTEYPEGYVRLLCVDEPISHRKQQERPKENSADFGHANEPVYSKPYSDDDGVPEAHSESDASAPNSDVTTSDDEDLVKMTEIVKNMPSTRRPFSPVEKMPLARPGTSKLPSLTKIQMPPPFFNHENEPYPPSVFVQAPTPPVFEGLPRVFDDGLLSPDRKPYNHLRPTPGMSSSARYIPGKETPSSGYETISTMSQYSSIASETMRERWQKKNINNLWEFAAKSRKDQIPAGAKYDPIPTDCYTEVKMEISYVPEEDEESEDDSEEEEDTEEDDSEGGEYGHNSGTGHPKLRRKDTEDEFERRFYLNSLQFSSNACSEFHHIGPIIRIPTASLSSAVVLGTSIRCPIPYTYPRDNEDEDLSTVGNYYVTYTFTPVLHSKAWPTGMYFRFNQQIFNRKVHGKMWPSREQMEQIELYGCNAIPIGYRPVEFFNTEQILEWELNFHECEINLLDSFRSPHWRAYIFSSILFRAFIAPLGPQGIGLEHIRNILYDMCYKDFYGWTDEQPGVHLNILLNNLFECLSKGYMPSFFVRSKNLLQSVPPHNLRYVQGHLKQIRENVVIYCIYAFRNMVNIRKTENSYSLPNFKDLYEILTVQEGSELLKFLNPTLRMLKNKEDEEMREQVRQKARTSKKKPKQKNLLDQQEEIENIEKNFFAHQKPQIEDDRTRRRLLREHRKHVMKQEELRKKNKEEQRLKEDPEIRLPDAEKRHSIDLKKMPVHNATRSTSQLRILLVIQFFVKHFLEMARKATTMHNYGQATMYVLQIENLCEICQEERYYADVVSPFSDDEFEFYREETLRLRGIIGKDMEQYILEKITSSNTQRAPPSPAQFLNEPAIDIDNMEFPTFTNNWDLRKLPTPPPTVPKPMGPTVKKLEKPNMVGSLQSFDEFSDTRMSSVSSTPSFSSPRNKARRQESIKFVSSMSPRDTPPPATPPRSSKLLSRQSMSISLDRDNDEQIESTDL